MGEPKAPKLLFLTHIVHQDSKLPVLEKKESAGRWVQSCRDSVSPDPSTLAPEVGIPLLYDLKKEGKKKKIYMCLPGTAR